METKYTDAEGQLGVGKNTSQAADARRAGKDHRYLPGHEKTLATFDAWRLVAQQCVLRFRSWLVEPRVTALLMADAIRSGAKT